MQSDAVRDLLKGADFGQVAAAREAMKTLGLGSRSTPTDRSVDPTVEDGSESAESDS
jgi:hypothetical protein